MQRVWLCLFLSVLLASCGGRGNGDNGLVIELPTEAISNESIEPESDGVLEGSVESPEPPATDNVAATESESVELQEGYSGSAVNSGGGLIDSRALATASTTIGAFESLDDGEVIGEPSRGGPGGSTARRGREQVGQERDRRIERDIERGDEAGEATGARSVFVRLDPESVIRGAGEDASAGARVTYYPDGRLSVELAAQGVDLTAVEVREGYAGAVGEALAALTYNQETGRWETESPLQLNETQSNYYRRGSLHLWTASEDYPLGALRGQILPEGITVQRFYMTGAEEVPPVPTAGVAEAYATINRNAQRLDIHLYQQDIERAVVGHLHLGYAGTDGEIVDYFEQNEESPPHWYLNNYPLTARAMSYLYEGQLYVNLHSRAFPSGEIRGQIPGMNASIGFATLIPEAVVPEVNVEAIQDRLPEIRLATTLSRVTGNAVFNLVTSSPDSSIISAGVYRGGNNEPGEMIFSLERDDSTRESHVRFTSERAGLSIEQQRSLEEGTYFVQLATEDYPNGAVRAPIFIPPVLIPEREDEELSEGFPGLSDENDRFVVPANGSALDDFPAIVTLSFNTGTNFLSENPIRLLASGGDGTFNDGNEVEITDYTIAFSEGRIRLNINDVEAEPDRYQVQLLDYRAPNSANSSTSSTFTVMSPNETEMDMADPSEIIEGFEDDRASAQAPTQGRGRRGPPEGEPTFSYIQEQLFAQRCSTCHTGDEPAAGLDLSPERAYESLINVRSYLDNNLFRVVPGDADASFLINKLEGTQSSGRRMPPFGAPLAEGIVPMVRTWVELGAQNN